jgi:hypothetical protein
MSSARAAAANASASTTADTKRTRNIRERLRRHDFWSFDDGAGSFEAGFGRLADFLREPFGDRTPRRKPRCFTNSCAFRCNKSRLAPYLGTSGSGISDCEPRSLP